MQLEERINAFVALGEFIGQFSSENPIKKTTIKFNDTYFDEMLQTLELAKSHNGWFTDENLRFTCKSWSDALSGASLKSGFLYIIYTKTRIRLSRL